MSHAGALEVGIVGAGIAGLAAAIALRRAGHNVEVFEKSTFKNEVGAAITMTSNANRVLHAWNFDFEKAGATENGQYRMLDAHFDPVYKVSFADNEALYGYKWFAFHRVDLHRALREMAEEPYGSSKPASIRLGSEISNIDVDDGNLTLKDGKEVKKDLLVLADGGRCTFGEAVTGKECPLQMIGVSAFRCLIPFDKISEDEGLWRIWKGETPGFYCLADFTKHIATICVTYACRSNSVMNCAILHQTREEDMDKEDWNSPSSLEALLDQIQDFPPTWQNLYRKADDVRIYNVGVRPPHDRIVNGNAVLIGDAAHTMLPSHAQGGAMAIEDAAALQVLFSDLNLPSLDSNQRSSLVRDRLQLYQKLRLPRSNTTQLCSNNRVGAPTYPEESIRKYYAGPLPPSTTELSMYGWGRWHRDFFNDYDVFEEAGKAVRGEEVRYFGRMSALPN